ncbi:uncharacterized protein LOC110933841 [Helianthus annuus]|uniref:uncharacterized protein LOC110933841 n=1 Tax=Helianthus annuus TaxID=4232 RepID=UPI000B8F45DE|nr:uncharacterized protein LOC110933841 [Helianthus annuus]
MDLQHSVDDLLGRVLDMDATARDTWVRLEKHFLSNKQTRAGALEIKFVNLTLAVCSSMDDYCQQLKHLANKLADVDKPITEPRLVLQLVRGLSQEFDTTAQLIHSQKADWDLARTMLNDEVIRQEARKQKNTFVLVAPAAAAANNSTAAAHNNQQPPVNHQQTDPNQQQYYRPRGHGRNQSGRGRGGRRRSSQGYSCSTTWAFQNQTGQPTYPQWAWWNIPPCPYPTQ